LVTTRGLRAKLSGIIDRVAFGGEYSVVTRHGKPLVAIVMPYDL